MLIPRREKKYLDINYCFSVYYCIESNRKTYKNKGNQMKNKLDYDILADLFPAPKKVRTVWRTVRPKPNSRLYKLTERAEKVGLILEKGTDREYPYEVTTEDGGTTAMERTLNNVLYRHIEPMEQKRNN